MGDVQKGNQFPIAQQLFTPTAPPALVPPKSNTIVGRYLNNKYLEQVAYAGELTTKIMDNFLKQQKMQQEYITEILTSHQRIDAIREEYVARAKIAKSSGQIAEIEAQERLLKFQLTAEKIQNAKNGNTTR